MTPIYGLIPEIPREPVLYLHPFYMVGVLVDIAILVALLLWARWPPVGVIGA